MKDQKIIVFPKILTIFTVLAFLVLMFLGVWQLQRLQWKLNLQTQIDENYATEAFPLTGTSLHSKVSVKGTYLNDKSIFILSKVHDGGVGKHLITPFETSSGIILVNRGWVPLGFQQASQNQPADIIGMLKISEKSNFMTPDNQPATDQWYWANVIAIAQSQNLSIFTKNLLWVIESSESAQSVSSPIPQGSKPILKNDHLSYAFFWFIMATALIVIYTLKIRDYFNSF